LTNPDLNLKLKKKQKTTYSSYSFFFFFFFFENGLTMGQKLKRSQVGAMNKQIKKLMSPLERLLVSVVGLESTRGRLQAKKKKR
jgi:hypothetical protein